MKTPNFKSQEPDMQHVYDVVNALTIGSKFNYAGTVYTVTGFTTKKVLTAQDVAFTPYEFNGYMHHGFLKIVL